MSRSTKAIATRIKFVIFFVFVAGLLLARKMYEVQIERHDYLFEKAKLRYTTHKTQKGVRGKILDFDGNLLVGNIPVKNVEADPSLIETPQAARLLADFFQKHLKLDAQRTEDVYQEMLIKERDRRIKIEEVQLFSKIAESTRTALMTAFSKKSKYNNLFVFKDAQVKGSLRYNVFVNPQELKTREEPAIIADVVAKKLRLSKSQEELLTKKLATRMKTIVGDKVADKWMVIKKDVDLLEANKVKDLLDSMAQERKDDKTKYTDFPFRSIIFRERMKRHYPKKELLSNILGFTNVQEDSDVGVSGVEGKLNESMTSGEAHSFYEKTRAGVPLSYGLTETEQITHGKNIYLTIQEPLQGIVEEELDKLMTEFKPEAAYAVMVDPATGNIMAMAQRPTFDPNDRSKFSKKTSKFFRNRLIEDTFEPGSTLKPIAVSRALDKNLVTPFTQFDCENGYWFYGGYPLRDSHGNDMMSVSQIIEESSNIGTAKIALLMGSEGLYNTMYDFGFGQRTGLPLRNETRGLLRHHSKWQPIITTRVCIGQGINVTPIQLARAYCALANKGRLPNLRLIDRIEDPNTGKVVPHLSNMSARELYNNPRTHSQMIEMMKRVVHGEHGTAKKVKVDGYYIAGKTGTSQKFIGGRYSKRYYFATFIGFAPAKNPRFVLLVSADSPWPKYYGGTVAGPAFKNITERSLKYLNVPPDHVYEDEINEIE